MSNGFAAGHGFNCRALMSIGSDFYRTNPHKLYHYWPVASVVIQNHLSSNLQMKITAGHTRMMFLIWTRSGETLIYFLTFTFYYKYPYHSCIFILRCISFLFIFLHCGTSLTITCVDHQTSLPFHISITFGTVFTSVNWIVQFLPYTSFPISPFLIPFLFVIHFLYLCHWTWAGFMSSIQGK